MKSLIFDCDGVLAETERDGHLVAFNRMFREVGLRVEWDEHAYSRFLKIAGGKERLRALCTPEFVSEHGLPRNSVELTAEIVNWHKIKTDIFLDLAAGEGMPARRGVRRLAQEALTRGWRIGVASTSTPDAVRAIAMKALGRDIVTDSVIVAGDMVQRKKPAPDVYLAAMNRLGATREESVAIEDSSIGVAAAATAGMSVIATRSHFTQLEDLSAAHIIVNDLGESGEGELSVHSSAINLQIKDHISIDHVTQCIEANNSMRPM